MTRDTPASLARRARPSRRSARAYIGLGANLGDATATLESAVTALSDVAGVRRQGVSRLYGTTPVGVTDQPPFRNAVVAIDVPMGRDPATAALQLLIALKEIERAAGRRRGRRWGPRELDLDLLVFGRHRLSLTRPPEGLSIDPVTAATPDGRLLVVPHPEAAERLFVLAPLADLAPGLVPPGWKETVTTARDRRLRIEGRDAAVALGVWDEETGSWLPIGAVGPKT